MPFEDLYQDIILDHYRNPCNFGEISEDNTAIEHENPVCGDRLKLIAEADEQGFLKSIRFHGSGCAISMASASMMTEAVKGKSLEEIQKIIQDFLAIMRGEKNAVDLENYGDLAALQGVIQFPVRIKCATLAWHALDQVLKSQKK